jgi:hypothetical protein
MKESNSLGNEYFFYFPLVNFKKRKEMDPILDAEIFLNDIVGVPENTTAHIKLNLKEAATSLDEDLLLKEIIKQLEEYRTNPESLTLAESLTQRNHFYRIAKHILNQMKIRLLTEV